MNIFALEQRQLRHDESILRSGGPTAKLPTAAKK